MVRRRSASPSASSPVRSSRGPSSKYSPPPRSTPPAPQATAPSQGPGLFGQMAATAGGVAIGSSIGHAVGNMFSGRGSNPEVQSVQDQQVDNKQPEGSCEVEWRQFVECTQNQSDMNFCQAYNDLFKNCKARYTGYQN